jgi:DNA-binding LacI/PurR family transcriptional regulator
MITREDVAKLAGVSPATVSNVINNSKFVSPDLIEKVERAIKDLNYFPNRAARALASHRTEQVGILVPSLTNPYHGSVAEGMEEVARKNGYIVSLITAEGPADRYMSHIIERQMDGIFLTDFGFRFTKEQFEHMRNHGVRFVVGEGSSYAMETCSTIPCSRISVNYTRVMTELFTYLKKLGHRRVAFLSGNPTEIREARKDEYVRCIQELGFEYDKSLLIPGSSPFTTLSEDGYRDTKKILQKKRKFSVLFALNDLMAIGAMKAIREDGLRIPDDISVVGCDNLYLSETTCPPLTTIHIPKREIGRLAMELLLEIIRGEDYRKVELFPSLVVRQSVIPLQ